MLVNVEPKHNGGHCCLEDSLYTVSNWWKRSCILMYAKAWDFGFRPLSTNESNRMIGNRLIAGVEHCWDCFQQYHGFQIEWHFKESVPEQFKIIQTELTNECPVIICIDAFWLPWARTYQLQHAKHYVVAIGLDDANQSIQCLDPFVLMETVVIPFDHFEQGNGRCIRVSIVANDAEQIDWHQIVKNQVEMLQTPKNYGRNSFADMYAFADAVENELDLAAEARLSKIPFLVPLTFRMRYIGVGHNKFGRVLGYLAEHVQLPEFLEMEEIIRGFGLRWLGIRQLYINGIESNSSEEQHKIAVGSAPEIRKLAEEEERFATTLLDFSRHYK